MYRIVAPKYEVFVKIICGFLSPENLESKEGREVIYMIAGSVASVVFVAAVLVIVFIIIYR